MAVAAFLFHLHYAGNYMGLSLIREKIIAEQRNPLIAFNLGAIDPS